MRKYGKWIALLACVLLLTANVFTGQAVDFEIDDAVISMGTTYWDLSPDEEYAFFVVRQGSNTASTIAAEDILYMNQAASDDYGTLSFEYLPNDTVSAQTELRGNSVHNAVELTWMLTDEGTLKLIASDSIPAFDTAPWASHRNQISRMVMTPSVEQISSFLFRGCTNLNAIVFEGDAPDFDPDAFAGVTAVVSYPLDNPTWTKDVQQSYGGNITWDDGHTHLYTQWTVMTKPGCETEGVEQSLCSCGEAMLRSIPALGHDHVPQTVLPTCVEQGYTKHICSRCGDSYINSYEAALGHSFGQWVVTIPATTSSPGQEKRVCSRCDETEFRIIGKLPIRFDDVPDNMYYAIAVNWAVDNGITNGVTETEFKPDQNCTRNQIVTFLWRAAGSPEPASLRNPFVDVKNSDYFYKAVLWAVEKGITTGLDDTHFGPNSVCTRAQVAMFLWRTLDKPAAGKNNPFTDIASNQWFYEPVLWAVDAGITNGIDKTHFGPDNPCTRGQIVTFLYRAMAN